MTVSDELFARALRAMPGGVHSPVRAFRRVGGVPRFIRAAHGSRLTDVDGREYLDFCLGFGPLILGHAPAVVATALREQLARGWSSGTAEPLSLELAELIVGRIPWVQQIRFVNSGTEAVMSALRIARAATGRTKLLKFDGCYHGHTDSMLVRAGSGLAGSGMADSAGVPESVAADTLVAPLDDETALERIFAAHGSTLAAAIIEPLPANFGLLLQRPAFLRRLAELCRESGALLIFDEVITGFRVAFGGMAELTGIRPDLVTYGKIIGGGLPVGAFGGRRELMAQVAPLGPVYQAGTLAANPLAMAAGLATLQALTDGRIYADLERLGRQIDSALGEQTSLRCQRQGSVFWLAPIGCDEAPVCVRRPGEMPDDIETRFAPLFHRLLDAGIYLPPSPYEVGFLSAAHTQADIRQLREALTGR